MIKFFYSNCFFEAVKAKIKDPKNVKLLYIPKGFNIESGGHWVWENKTTDPDGKFYYEFAAPTRKHNSFWFKGAVTPTAKSQIHRMINLVHARDKTLRKIEAKFGMKFNQCRVEELLKTVSLFDWQTFDEEFYPLPTVDMAPKMFDFDTKYHSYEPTKLKPKIMGFVRDENSYQIFDFDESGKVATNGKRISWWKWEMFKDPVSYKKDWERIQDKK